jgi:hypothetical protein
LEVVLEDDVLAGFVAPPASFDTDLAVASPTPLLDLLVLVEALAGADGLPTTSDWPGKITGRRRPFARISDAVVM